MKTREIYNGVRTRRKQIAGLRLRLILMVSLELILVDIAAYLLDGVIPDYLLGHWEGSSLLWLIILSLLVGSVLTWALSVMFFDPIKKLRKAMETVADGDFSVRLESNATAREIQEIYSGFNLMAHELSNMEILQSDFVSNASHEFKTPLNAIEGYSMLLQNSGNLDEQQQEYVEKIIFNTKRLSTLTGSILLLSKIENQAIPTKQYDFRLDEQIRQSIVSLEPEWEKKGIEFDVGLEDVTYFGNENLLHHVWDNLIGNAVKFNPVGGTVGVRLKRQEKQIVCTVSDCGPGISEEAKKHIYDKFYQADSSHKEEGNGLGLALVNRILMLEGGTVCAENLPQGGCQFTVVLNEK